MLKNLLLATLLVPMAANCSVSLQNHKSFGDTTINLAEIKNNAEIFGSFEGKEDVIENLTVWGPMSLDKCHITKLKAWGPAFIKNSIASSISLHGISKVINSKITNITSSGLKIDIKNSNVSKVVILSNENHPIQSVYVSKNTKIDVIEFKSGSGKVYMEKSMNTKVIGGIAMILKSA